MSDRTLLIEAIVGSPEWVYTVQEDILDQRSPCFVCGRPITYKRDFFYMRGHMGTIMMHTECFSPSTKTKLPTGELMSLFEASRYSGIRYQTLYQRVRLGRLAAVKRDGIWHISKDELDDWKDLRRSPDQKKPALPKKKGPKNRIWRSEITEAPERIAAMVGARMIGVSRSWILARKEQFDAVKISGAWYVSRKLVEDYISNEERDGVESPS